MTIKGDIVTSLAFDQIKFFSREGVAPVMVDKQWKYINEVGNTVIDDLKDVTNAEPFIGTIAAVKINKKWGFINRQGKLVTPDIYDDIAHIEPLYGNL